MDSNYILLILSLIFNIFLLSCLFVIFYLIVRKKFKKYEDSRQDKDKTLD